jgi:hypothetical protein
MGTGALGIFKTAIEYVAAVIDHKDLILTIFIQVGGVAFMTLIVSGTLMFILSWASGLVRRLFGKIAEARYSALVPQIALIAAFVIAAAYFIVNHSALMAAFSAETRYFYMAFGAVVILMMCVYAFLFAKKYAGAE